MPYVKKIFLSPASPQHDVIMQNKHYLCCCECSYLKSYAHVQLPSFSNNTADWHMPEFRAKLPVYALCITNHDTTGNKRLGNVVCMQILAAQIALEGQWRRRIIASCMLYLRLWNKNWWFYLRASPTGIQIKPGQSSTFLRLMAWSKIQIQNHEELFEK